MTELGERPAPVRRNLSSASASSAGSSGDSSAVPSKARLPVPGRRVRPGRGVVTAYTVVLLLCAVGVARWSADRASGVTPSRHSVGLSADTSPGTFPAGDESPVEPQAASLLGLAADAPVVPPFPLQLGASAAARMRAPVVTMLDGVPEVRYEARDPRGDADIQLRVTPTRPIFERQRTTDPDVMVAAGTRRLVAHGRRPSRRGPDAVLA